MTVTIIILLGLLSVAAAVVYWRKVAQLSPIAGATEEQGNRLLEISGAISEGASAFLMREYKYMLAYMAVFGLVVWVLVDFASAFSFIVGSAISILAGFIGMKAATMGNVRTTAAAQTSLGGAFRVAFNSGAVMGFGLVGLAVLGLIAMYLILTAAMGDASAEHVMEALAGFGLGGSSIALFARVGGGIYTKAADVGADLVGKVEENIPEDDPRNPAVIADNVGDNVGDIAGMGADLFGSVAESTCAALVIGSVAYAAGGTGALLFPILITAISIPVALVSTFFAKAETPDQIESSLKRALIVSTVLMAVVMGFVTYGLLPDSFELVGHTYSDTGVYLSLLAGLFGGLAIGIATEFYTSHRFAPVREVAKASETGAATNIIYGLSLGYQSSMLPVIFIALAIYVGYFFAGMYGIAIASLGMLGTLAIGLTIDAFGPVADNAGGIAEMSELPHEVRERTDALDAAGNTTAAIGKGFAIGSAALTGLALYSAFLVRSDVETLNLLRPQVMAFLFAGALLPFLFTAMTLKSVGRAAMDMIKEVRHQFATIPGLREGTARADYRRCVDISTAASLREMILPGAQVILTPIVVGYLFGVEALAGLLAGSMAAGVVLAISSANAGGAWDNAKKYIEAGALGGKGTPTHAAAVVGDTVGDPFKDTSGPSLNVLIKLQAIISLVFAPFFAHSLNLLG